MGKHFFSKKKWLKIQKLESVWRGGATTVPSFPSAAEFFLSFLSGMRSREEQLERKKKKGFFMRYRRIGQMLTPNVKRQIYINKTKSPKQTHHLCSQPSGDGTHLSEFELPAKAISPYLRIRADLWLETGGRLSWRSIKQFGTSISLHLSPPWEI